MSQLLWIKWNFELTVFELTVPDLYMQRCTTVQTGIFWKKKLWWSSDRSRTSHTGGTNPWVWGKNPLFSKFLLKSAWKWKKLDRDGVHVPSAPVVPQLRSASVKYRSETVNLNTVNSKFRLIQSYCEIFFYNFPNIPCLKCTVNSNFHLIRSKTLPTNDFELTVPDL